MCLYVGSTKKKIATEPVKVYKYLTESNNAPYNPEYQYVYGINKPVMKNGRDGKLCNREAGGGFLHAFLDKKTALIAAADHYWWDKFDGGPELKVVEMYIPEGTGYYSDNHHRVAADALEFKEDSPVYAMELAVEIETRKAWLEDLPF